MGAWLCPSRAPRPLQRSAGPSTYSSRMSRTTLRDGKPRQQLGWSIGGAGGTELTNQLVTDPAAAVPEAITYHVSSEAAAFVHLLCRVLPAR